MPLSPDRSAKPIEPPIRAELFGSERLEQHAESLAAAQSVVGRTGKGRPLLPRVQDNGRVLREGYRALAHVIREERAITPAAEWLVDNFHIVDEQLREIRDDLPVGFYRELPKLADGPHQGYPRVYGIAWAFVAHTDSRFDPDALRRFVQAYQRVQPLTIGELWAIAITLRVVLVENLRRLPEGIVRGRALRQAADTLAADPRRARQAMSALEDQLIRRDDGLMLLFTPPFTEGAEAAATDAADGVVDAATTADPGYIKAYPPGIRENGGQYTHAALWTVIAFAELGEGDKADELFGMLSPIYQASDPAAVERYKVEPYAVAADVYAEPAHVGRGGWTWYTGSAAWMYRAGIEWLLGFRVRGAFVEIDPCIPRAWPGFEITFKYGASRYEVTVENPQGVSRGVATIEVDGARLAAGTTRVALTDDGRAHGVRVVMG